MGELVYLPRRPAPQLHASLPVTGRPPRRTIYTHLNGSVWSERRPGHYRALTPADVGHELIKLADIMEITIDMEEHALFDAVNADVLELMHAREAARSWHRRHRVSP